MNQLARPSDKSFRPGKGVAGWVNDQQPSRGEAASPYQALLIKPLSVLVLNESDHADVMSSAILGYN